MAVSKGDNLWRGFGLVQSPKHDSRLNRQRVSREFFFADEIANRCGAGIFVLTTVLAASMGFPACGRFNKCCGNKKAQV
jgi:hypothetical protein